MERDLNDKDKEDIPVHSILNRAAVPARRLSISSSQSIRRPFGRSRQLSRHVSCGSELASDEGYRPASPVNKSTRVKVSRAGKKH